MHQIKAEEAIEAYIKFLKSQSVDSEAIAIRTRFVKKIVVLLKDQFDRKGYGRAVQTLLKIEDTIEQQQQMNFAREFYPFWVSDFKAIAKTRTTYGLDFTSIKFQTLPSPLNWASIDELSALPLDQVEGSMLNEYKQSLKKQNELDNAIQEKLKLATVVLLRLRDIPVKDNLAFRIAVDLTLPLFELEDLKQRFLETIREFYYTWINTIDPTYLSSD